MSSDFQAYIDQLNQQIAQLTGQHRYEEAIALATSRLDFVRQRIGEESTLFAVSLYDLARLYYMIGEYGKAEPLYQQALAILRADLGEQHPAVATSLNDLGMLYENMGDYSKAEPQLKQALAIWRAALGEQHPDVATSLNNLGRLYDNMGEYNKAELLYQQALAIRRTVLGEQHPDVAQSLNNLGMLYDNMGEYDKAEPLYQQALAIMRAVLGEQHPDTATSLNNLAGLYYKMGEYGKAEPLFEQALAIRRAALGEQHPAVATSLNNLGMFYEYMGEYRKAEPLFEQALAIRRAVLPEQHPALATSLNNLAGLYRDMGEYDKAEPLFEQALAIRRAALGEQHPDVAAGLNSLAALYMNIGEYLKAEPLLKQALAIWRTALGELHPVVAGCLSNLACVRIVLGRETEAFSLLQQALAIEDQMISQIFSSGSERRRMAYLATVQGKLAGFLSLVLQFFLSSPERVQAAMDAVLQRKGIAAEALAAQRDALLGNRYPSLALQLEQLRALRTQIVQKTLSGPGAESIRVYRQRLSEWTAQKEQLEADLARHIPEMNLAQQLHRANRQVISSILPHNTLLIEFVRFDLFDFYAVPARGEHWWKDAHYISFVLSSNDPNQVQLIDLGEAKRIDELIAAFRMQLSGQKARDLLPTDEMADKVAIEQAGKELRTMVFDPLLPHLKAGRRLFLAPDGDLSRLPFEVLPTDDRKRLIDYYQFNYVSVGRDLLRFISASDRQPQAPIVMADPDFDLAAPPHAAAIQSSESTDPRSAELRSHLLTFERLPGTRQEGQQIAQALGVQALFDRQAVVNSLKALRSPHVLHLATHGFFLPDQPHDPNKEFSPLTSQQLGMMGTGGMEAPDRLTWLMGQHLENPLVRSGLAFAGANTWNRGETLPPEAGDGLLTAEDVSGLDLLDTELVVLSACETGLGAVQVGEGVFGLRRTFMLAGAKTLVMSLWKVPDTQTQELMQDFYRRLLAGQPRAEALREAQLALKEKHPHPYFWGAFICQGNPGPLP